MLVLSYFALSFAITLWFSRFIIRYLDPTHFMDHPDLRKMHDNPTPRYGGIAFTVVIIILGWFLINVHGVYTWYFLGAIGMFLIGVLDDYNDLLWVYKLICQIFIGLMIAIQFIPFIEEVSFFNYTLPFPKWVLVSVFIFWFIGISNAINLIDGLDGLSGGLMFLITSTAGILGLMSGNMNFLYINVIILSSLLAFLHYNQRPAKFFMGDSGSLFLGYHLAVMPLLFITMDNGISNIIDVTAFILLSTYLIADTVRVFVLRIRMGRNPFAPDRLHLHFQIYDQCKMYNVTLLTIYILCSICCLLSVLSVFAVINSFSLMLLYFVILGGFIFIPMIYKNFVNLILNIYNSFGIKKIGYYSILSILKLNMLPYVIGIYFISLAVLNSQELYHLTNFPFLLILVTFISLLFMREKLTYNAGTAILISFAIIQVHMLSLNMGSLYLNSDQSNLYILFYLIKYGALIIVSIITITHYILNPNLYHKPFWSVTDLLIIILLIGMIGLKPIGLGFPATFSFELGLLYFANKLWVPQLPDLFIKKQIQI